MPATAINEDGWIEWKGGVCPVHEGEQFVRRYRGGVEFGPMKAWSANMRPVVWEHCGNGMDIIAYRVVQS